MCGKGTKVYSIFLFKCPRCHEGNLFVNSNPYNLKTTGKMNERCSVCDEDFNPEPGYYFGATYVSYALVIIVGTAAFLIGYLLFGVISKIAIIGSVVVLAPIIVMLSRAIWINFFVKYRKDWKTFREKQAEES